MRLSRTLLLMFQPVADAAHTIFDATTQLFVVGGTLLLLQFCEVEPPRQVHQEVNFRYRCRICVPLIGGSEKRGEALPVGIEGGDQRWRRQIAPARLTIATVD